MTRLLKYSSALLALCNLFGQAPNEVHPGAKGVLTVPVSGTVINQITNLPLSGMVVQVSGSTGWSATSQSDKDGKFLFSAVPIGQYQVFVRQKTGFYFENPRRLLLSKGSNPVTVDLEMVPDAILTGRVLNRNKEPVRGAMVSARSQAFRSGHPTLGSFRSARSNDLGEYRIGNLRPGQYYVEAEPAPLRIDSMQTEAKDFDAVSPVMTNAGTYYANATTPEAATLVTVHSGQHLDGLDIELARVNTNCTRFDVDRSGKVLKPDIISIVLSEAYPTSQSRVASSDNSAGPLQVCGLSPGDYRMVAFANDATGQGLWTVVLYLRELLRASTAC